MELVDMMGRLVYSNVKLNSQETTTDVTNYEAGIYFLNIHADGKIEIRRFVLE